MRCLLSSSALLVVLVFQALSGEAQEKSVKPGINDPFRQPDVAEFTGKFETESREVYAHREKIVEACAIRPGQTVADIGAGTGLFTRLFSEAVGPQGRVIAVDISQKFLDHIQQTSRAAGQTNVEVRLSTAESTGLPAASVDVAFICDTYHHFEFPQKTMASLHQALKPGGRVILIDFRREEGVSSEWTLNHVRAGQSVFESEILESGFVRVGERGDLLKENYFVEFQKSPLQYPIIAKHGGVVPRPMAVEPPRAGAKVLFDVTADSKVDAVNRGLDRVARLLNLYGASGLKAGDVKLTVVLHGDATRTTLTDAAYKARFEYKENPNLPLIRELQRAGVEVLVCGQALNYKGFADDEVAQEVPMAVAALTVSINRQSDGYVVISVP